MGLASDKKSEIMQEYGREAGDTGSPEVQIALLTAEIRELTEHFKEHKQDHHSRQGLMKKVGRRKRLMKYLKRENPKRYQEVIERLGIRG